MQPINWSLDYGLALTERSMIGSAQPRHGAGPYRYFSKPLLHPFLQMPPPTRPGIKRGRNTIPRRFSPMRWIYREIPGGGSGRCRRWVMAAGNMNCYRTEALSLALAWVSLIDTIKDTVSRTLVIMQGPKE